MATTIHSSQLVAEPRVVMQAHDSPLYYIAAEAEFIVTGNTDPRPHGVDWDAVQPDQFASIPSLAELRKRITRG
jgi:5-formyltetrahydrofolate cyclo-ligase